MKLLSKIKAGKLNESNVCDHSSWQTSYFSLLGVGHARYEKGLALSHKRRRGPASPELDGADG